MELNLTQAIVKLLSQQVGTAHYVFEQTISFISAELLFYRQFSESQMTSI